METEPTFTLGTREVLFEKEYLSNPFRANYDIHPDGEHFVMIESLDSSTHLVFVLNWLHGSKGSATAEPPYVGNGGAEAHFMSR